MSERVDGRHPKPRRPRHRRPLTVERVENRLLMATFTVTTVADGTGNNIKPITGSLRQAIVMINASTDATNQIQFAIGSGPQVIEPVTALPAVTVPVTIDARPSAAEPGQRIELLGDKVVGYSNGLVISGGNSTIEGLTVGDFVGAGLLLISKGGDLIQSDTIGTDPSGNPNLGNQGDGLYVQVPNNTIGGSSLGSGNVISGNQGSGVDLSGPKASGNLVQGNVIGLDPSGSQPVRNGQNGVFINSASSNTIGGTSLLLGNVISGNVLDGINISASTDVGASIHNLIIGNAIGPNTRGDTDFAATGPISSTGNLADGIHLDGSKGDVSTNTIGGTIGGARNIISDNSNNGIEIAGRNIHAAPLPTAVANNELIQGNFIGTDLTGEFRAPNGGSGVRIIYAKGIIVGGTDRAARNIISANQIDGIEVNQASGETITGNYVGADFSGYQSLGNIRNGISATFDGTNTIGGTTPGAGNLIFGNGVSGLSLASSEKNLIQGNTIGLNLNNDAFSKVLNKTDNTLHAIGNDDDGITLNISSTNNTIGGITPSARNVISGNLKNGISMVNASDFNLIEGNFIGLDSTGTRGRGNNIDGIYDESSSNTIGGSFSVASNVISGNLNDGVMITTSSATGNIVQGNLIGTNFVAGESTNPTDFPQIGADNLPIGNRANGVFVANDATLNLIGGSTLGSGNVISGNGGNGVQLFDINYNQTVPGDIVQGNIIGLAGTSGTISDGNGGDGLLLNEARSNVIGGSVGSAGNVISENTGNGIEINGPVSTFNLVQGNLIGTDTTGTQARGNNLAGVSVFNADSNTIGGATPGSGNVISGNLGDGVDLASLNLMTTMLNLVDTKEVVVGNVIGLAIGGFAPLVPLANLPQGNGGDGVKITNTGIGSNPAVVNNTISGNGDTGVEISGATSGATILANKIGTDASGSIAIGNRVGVSLDGAPVQVVGAAGLGNVISGNRDVGVQVTEGSSTSQVVVESIQANLIGTDASGEVALGNGIGVYLNNVIGVTVGGPSLGEGNVISGNTVSGVELSRVDDGDSGQGDVIQGNDIGLDVAGKGLPAGGFQPIGIFISSAANNLIVGNLISGNVGKTSTINNPSFGVSIFGEAVANSLKNVIVGNLIGQTAFGALLLDPSGNPLQTVGVGINSSDGNVVGGSLASNRNMVVGNEIGVEIAGIVATTFKDASGKDVHKTVTNLIQGNTLDANSFGVFINSAQLNDILNNDISANTAIGLSIVGSEATGNMVTGDMINANTQDGIYIESAASNNVPGATPNLIQNDTIDQNGQVGVYVARGANGNLIHNNTIQSNKQYGIFLFNSAGNIGAVPLNGSAANNTSGNGIANFREFTGPENSTVTTTSNKTKTTKGQ